MTTIKIKLTKVAQAYERAKPVRDVLHQVGRCMEVTEDKCGIVWERWLVGKSQVVLFATPHYTEVFHLLTAGMTWDEVTGAVKKLAEVS